MKFLSGILMAASTIWIRFDFVDRQLPVGVKNGINLLILHQAWVFFDEFKNLIDNLYGFVKYVVKHPLVYPSAPHQTRTFQVTQVPAGFGLGKIQDVF